MGCSLLQMQDLKRTYQCGLARTQADFLFPFYIYILRSIYFFWRMHELLYTGIIHTYIPLLVCFLYSSGILPLQTAGRPGSLVVTLEYY